jgi:hypothetical protein
VTRVGLAKITRNAMRLCDDCGRDGEDYMGRDDVWMAANPWNAHGGLIRFLCLACLERRIGRALVASDFPDLPINDRRSS